MAIPREPFGKLEAESCEQDRVGLRRDYTPAPQVTLSYLLGVLHDATKRKSTYRIATNSKAFGEILKRGIHNLGANVWMYGEGKTRDLWIVEFSQNLLKGFTITSKQQKIDYIRGYFDAEGGVAKDPNIRYYLYFAQKDRSDIEQLRSYLESIGICCGKIHNSSKRVDPNYWRFYVSAKSYTDFAKFIGSSHPEKRRYLRMKI